MDWTRLPLLAHAVVEAAAAVSFLLAPESQLPAAFRAGTHGKKADAREREARAALLLILRSYGGLLLSSAILAAFFGVPSSRVVDDAASARVVSLCLAVYHPWPVWRACGRLRSKDGPPDQRGRVPVRRDGKTAAESENRERPVLGGPAVHLVLHVSLFVGLLLSAWSLSYAQ
ncbi:hypothetical protein VTK73DRAFT_4760 [Phialemonium thermophilum]|uniref:Uncharacterized protein n=1 Tax=Phialemonium thermophilum TaxID=223376 RepID=A0ABR3V713_9PEZI